MYRVTWLYGRVLCAGYYRVQTVGGQVPESGPLLVVTNHSNGLVDGGLLFLLTARPLRIIIKSTILRMPLVGTLARWAGCVPVYRRQDDEDTSRNEDSFRAVHEALRQGEAISIFPEGTSKDPRPSLRPFKTGAARMALGAEDTSPPPGIQFLPVGLLYEERDRFRSHVHVWVGEPRPVAPLLESYRADPLRAVDELTDEVAEQMREVTLQLERFDDRQRLDRAEELWPQDDRPQTERLQRLARGLNWMRERRPDEARDLLHDLGSLEFGAVDAATAASPGALARAGSLLLAAAWAFALTLCALAWLPVLVPIQLIARFARPSPDKFVTMILLSTSVLAPLWTLSVTLGLWLTRGPAVGLGALAALAATLLAGRVLWERQPSALRAWRRAVAPSTLALQSRLADDLRRRLAHLARLADRLDHRESPRA